MSCAAAKLADGVITAWDIFTKKGRGKDVLYAKIVIKNVGGAGSKGGPKETRPTRFLFLRHLPVLYKIK